MNIKPIVVVGVSTLGIYLIYRILKNSIGNGTSAANQNPQVPQVASTEEPNGEVGGTKTITEEDTFIPETTPTTTGTGTGSSSINELISPSSVSYSSGGGTLSEINRWNQEHLESTAKKLNTLQGVNVFQSQTSTLTQSAY